MLVVSIPLVIDILRTLLAAYKQNPDVLAPDSIRLLLRDFIATNIKQFGVCVVRRSMIQDS